jgi:hypothetical protein
MARGTKANRFLKKIPQGGDCPGTSLIAPIPHRHGILSCPASHGIISLLSALFVRSSLSRAYFSWGIFVGDCTRTPKPLLLFGFNCPFGISYFEFVSSFVLRISDLWANTRGSGLPGRQIARTGNSEKFLKKTFANQTTAPIMGRLIASRISRCAPFSFVCAR